MPKNNFGEIDEVLSGAFNPSEMQELLEDVDLSEWAGHNLNMQGEQALDRATADAQAFLLDRTDRFKALGMPGQLSEEFEQLDSLPNSDKYPEAYRKGYGKNNEYGEILFGTEYETNGVTGTRMAVPSTDPTDSKKPLAMFLGSREQAAKNVSPRAQEFLDVENASEYVQRQVMRRMGLSAEMNNQSGVTLPDFKVGNEVIDGQIRKGSDNKLQTHTWVDPIDASSDLRKDGPVRSGEAARVKGAINQGIDNNPDMEFKSVVEKIGDPNNPDRTIQGRYGYGPGEGKLYASGDYHKDKVFYTHLTPEQARNNQFADTTSYAPQDIDVVDTNKAQEVVAGMRGEELKGSLKVNPNHPGKTINPRTGETKFPKRTQVNIDIPAKYDSQYKQTGKQLLDKFPQVGQFLDGAGKLMRNPAVRLAGTAFAAVPVLGDAADATTGTIDTITKTGDQQVRGAGNAVAGLTGLATLAAPAAAPILAPVSAGLGIGNALADNAKERKQDRSIGESSKYERSGAFSHTEDNPVSIGLPGTASPVQSETQRRRQARRSSSGKTPVTRPQTSKQWWEKGVDSLMNYFN